MTQNEPIRWLSAGEKYAIIGLDCETTSINETLFLGPNLFALPHKAFQLPAHWRKWLGTTRAEEVEAYRLYVVAKLKSQTPTILDGENQALERRINHFYTGLQLARKLALYSKSFSASGGWSEQDGVDVRRFYSIEQTGVAIVNDWAPISPAVLGDACTLGARLEAIVAERTASRWRLLRCLALFQDASNARDILERIHQFTRCVEGFILPAQGNTKRQFKSRTELFIGPKHHDLIGEIYDVRSDVEHLHENRLLENFDRAQRIRLAKCEAVIEWIARSCLKRIVLDPEVTPHFCSETTLHDFWALDATERQRIWGQVIDPLSPLNEFNFDHVGDDELGAAR